MCFICACLRIKIAHKIANHNIQNNNSNNNGFEHQFEYDSINTINNAILPAYNQIDTNPPPSYNYIPKYPEINTYPVANTTANSYTTVINNNTSSIV